MKIKILKPTMIRGVAVRPGDVVEADEAAFSILSSSGKAERVAETPPVARTEPPERAEVSAKPKAARKRASRKQAKN